jgi:hypothetical protein
MDDDLKREKKLKEHTKVGKDYKQQMHDREKILIEVENELV